MASKKEETEVTDPWQETGPAWAAPAEAARETDLATITLKGGRDDSWIVFHPRSMEEAEEILEDQDRLHALMEKVVAAEATFKRLVKAANGPSTTSQGFSKPSGGGGWGNKKPKASGGSKHECEHGEREERSGRSAKGQWTGYFCPEKVCDPVWG